MGWDVRDRRVFDRCVKCREFDGWVGRPGGRTVVPHPQRNRLSGLSVQ